MFTLAPTASPSKNPPRLHLQTKREYHIAMHTGTAPHESTTDESSVQATLAGNRDAFGNLVQRYFRSVRALCYSATPSEADDLAQDIFLKAFLALDQLRSPEKFAPWLMQIARNHVRAHFRSRHADTAAHALTQEPQHTPDMEAAELRALLRQHIDALDESAREAIVLHYFAGNTIRETAELLGITAEAAAKRIQRARETLSEQLLAAVKDDLPQGERTKRSITKIMAAVSIASPAWETQQAHANLHGSVKSGRLARAGVSGATAWLLAGMMVIGVAVGVSQWRKADTPVPPAQGQIVHAVAHPNTTAPRANTGKDKKPDATESSKQDSTSTTKIASTQYAPATADEPLGPGRIDGVIVDESMTPVANAEVRLASMTAWTIYDNEVAVDRTIQSDRSGRFVFNGIPANESNYAVTAKLNDLYGGTDTYLSKRRLEWTALVVLRRGNSIVGEVVDESNNPIPGAKVYLVEHKESDHVDESIAEALHAECDATGRFEFPALLPGHWKLQADSPGFIAGVSDWIATNSSTTRLSMVRGKILRGRLVEKASKNPIPNATIIAGFQGLVRRIDRSKTNSDGMFEVSGLMPGTFYLHILNCPFVLESQGFSLEVPSLGDPADVVLEAVLGGSISGFLVNKATSAPVASAKINVNHEDGYSGSTTTDEQGAFTVDGLRPGSYTITTKVGWNPFVDFAVGATTIVREGEATKDLRIEVDPGASIKGVLRDAEDNPVARMMIYTSQETEKGLATISAGITNESGEFVIAGLDPGARLALHAGSNRTNEDEFVIEKLPKEGIEGIELRLRPSRQILGLVVDSNGLPVPRAGLDIVNPDGSRTSTMGLVNVLYDGSFRIKAIEPGDYLLRATRNRGDFKFPVSGPVLDSDIPINIPETGEIPVLRVQIEDGPILLVGIVVDIDGNPVSNAEVTGKCPREIRRTRTADDGSWRLRGLPDEPIDLSANKGGSLNSPAIQIEGSTDGIELRLNGRVE